MATHLNISIGAFKRKYVRMVENKNTLLNTDEGCVFLGEDNKCAVYEVRPYPCRTFPFVINLKAGFIEVRYVEACPVVTAFFYGFMAFIQRYYPEMYKTFCEVYDSKPFAKHTSSVVTLPAILVFQYVMWVMMDKKEDYDKYI